MTLSSAETALDRSAPRRARDGKMGPLGIFFRGFLKHPVMVGSIIPSSGKLIEKMLSRVDWANTKVFVEYGPGVGTFCQHILDRMAPDATLIAIDTNSDFIGYLRHRIVDSRFDAVEGSAADVRKILAERGFDHADFILSGLPFSTLPPGVGATIAAETQAALRAGGAFLVYQFSPKVRDFLAPHFERIDHGMEVVNIPPAQLYWAWKS
ncbi:MAG: type 11 methyltransferase [Sphingomonas bacterium]|jgi:phospholipid N-methyltransferase|nr:type 11 methyltransferase [Sphingomonas bacterium]MDB5718086.1 type 11 methyltransferase [Sphingomonas bacterium]